MYKDSSNTIILFIISRTPMKLYHMLKLAQSVDCVITCMSACEDINVSCGVGEYEASFNTNTSFQIVIHKRLRYLRVLQSHFLCILLRAFKNRSSMCWTRRAIEGQESRARLKAPCATATADASYDARCQRSFGRLGGCAKTRWVCVLSCEWRDKAN